MSQDMPDLCEQCQWVLPAHRPGCRDSEYEYATVRSDDAAKWIGRDGWEPHTVTLCRRRPTHTGSREEP